MATTAGSVALQPTYATSNACVVDALEQAGAAMLGKTHMSELGLSFGRLGYSALGGVVHNPNNLLHNASGSSQERRGGVVEGVRIVAA